MAQLAAGVGAAELTPAHETWRARVFVATWLAYVGFYFCRKPFSTVKSSLGHELGFDATTLGQIGAVYLLAYALGQFVAGWLGPRVGPRVLLLSGAALTMAVGVGFGFGHSRASYFVFMAVNGVAQASGWSSCVGTMANWFHRHERGRVMGLWATNFQVGSLGAGWFSGWVLGQLGWRWAFWSGSAVVLAVWFVILLFQRNKPEDVALEPVAAPEGAKEEGRLVWTRAVVTNILLVGAFYFFAKLIRYALWSWVPFFLERNYGLTGSHAAYLGTLFDVAGIPGVMVTGWLSDRYFGSRRAGVSCLMMALMTVFSAVLLFGGGTSLIVFAVCLALVGFTLYGPDALMTGAGAMDIGDRATAVRVAGIISGIGSMGPVLQELVIGKLYDAKGGALGPVFALLFGSAAVSLVAVGAIVIRGRLGKSAV